MKEATTTPPELRLLPEFEQLHRELTTEERTQLHADLDLHGMLSPLVVWQEEGVLLDGHNRLRWANKNQCGVTTIELSFPDQTAALR